MKKFILIIIIVAVVVGLAFLAQKVNTNGTQNSQPTNTPDQFMIQGMQVEILQQGTGAEVKNGDKVAVHYTGILTNGTKFDSSVDRGQPFSFTLGAGEVIRGWDLGVLGMKVGEKRKLTIPPELAYGETGTPGGPIPPNATLIFEVELLSMGQ